MHRKVKEVAEGCSKFTAEQLFPHIPGAFSYTRGLHIKHLIQPVRVNAPCSHTSAHEVLGPELERSFAAPFTFAACAHYLVKMAS